MTYAVKGAEIEIDCDDRIYAEVLLETFAHHKLTMHFIDDRDRQNAGGGWEAIIVLADPTFIHSVLAAMSLSAGIAIGEMFKEASKDLYHSIKAAVKNCISKARTTGSPPEAPDAVYW